MSNIEKISAYLENELSASERQQFEQQLNNDPALKNEYDFQREIVDGLKEARRVELKTMLDNVPVGGAGAGGAVTFGKVVTGVALIGAIAFSIYYFGGNDSLEKVVVTEEEPVELAKPQEKIETENRVVESEESTTESSTIENEPVKTESAQVNEDTPEKVSSREEPAKAAEPTSEPEIKKPMVTMFDSAHETDSLEAPGNTIVNKTDNAFSSLDVEIDNSNRKFSFHYQFNSGKLFLYGDFDKELYEILEFKTRSDKSLFLNYKDKFYPLNKKNFRITPLEPVKESTLIEKLEKVAGESQE